MTLLTVDRFPHRCQIRRRSRTNDDMAGSTDSFSLVHSNIPCWRQIVSEREITEFQKRGHEVTDRIYFLTNLHLSEEHIIEIGNETFEVVSWATPDATAGLARCFRAMVRITSTGST